MSSSRFPTTAMPQLNTTREFSSISAAVVLLLLSFLSTKAPNRMWRRLLTTFTQHWDSILTMLFHLLLFPRMATRSTVWMTNAHREPPTIKTKKMSHQIVTRPTQVVLLLSPNHGLFGNDGLYSESKTSLKMLFNHWFSESWGEYLCPVGAVIG